MRKSWNVYLYLVKGACTCVYKQMRVLPLLIERKLLMWQTEYTVDMVNIDNIDVDIKIILKKIICYLIKCHIKSMSAYNFKF